MGFWENNLPHGMGTYNWFKKNRTTVILTNRYVGEFSQGLKNGVGTFFFADGSKYEGEFKNNLKHGLGVFTKDDGNIHISKYSEDRIIKKIKENINPDTFFHEFSQPQQKSPFDELEKHTGNLLEQNRTEGVPEETKNTL